jgi:hypothetical protein
MPFLISRCCLGQGTSASLGSRPEKGILSSSHRGSRTLEINQLISRVAENIERQLSSPCHGFHDGTYFFAPPISFNNAETNRCRDDVLPSFSFASIPDDAFIAISLAAIIPRTQSVRRWKVPLNSATNAKRRGDANTSTSEERARDIDWSGHFTRRE